LAVFVDVNRMRLMNSNTWMQDTTDQVAEERTTKLRFPGMIIH